MPNVIPTPTDQLVEDIYDSTIRREQADKKLAVITERTKRELETAGIRLPVFYLLPATGDAFVTVGTTHDPSDEEWDIATGIAIEIVEEVLGVGRLRSRRIVCASANSVNDPSEAGHAIP